MPVNQWKNLIVLTFQVWRSREGVSVSRLFAKIQGVETYVAVRKVIPLLSVFDRWKYWCDAWCVYNESNYASCGYYGCISSSKTSNVVYSNRLGQFKALRFDPWVLKLNSIPQIPYATPNKGLCRMFIIAKDRLDYDSTTSPTRDVNRLQIEKYVFKSIQHRSLF